MQREEEGHLEGGPSHQLPGFPLLLSWGWQLALTPRAERRCCYLLLGRQLVTQLPTALHCSQWTGWQVGGIPLWQQVGGGERLLSSWQGRSDHPSIPLHLPLPHACAGGWTKHGRGWPVVPPGESFSSCLTTENQVPQDHFPSSFLPLSLCLLSLSFIPFPSVCLSSSPLSFLPFTPLSLSSSQIFFVPAFFPSFPSGLLLSPALSASPTLHCPGPTLWVLSLQLEAGLGQRTLRSSLDGKLLLLQAFPEASCSQ